MKKYNLILFILVAGLWGCSSTLSQSSNTNYTKETKYECITLNTYDNKELLSELSVINEKTSPYLSKFIVESVNLRNKIRELNRINNCGE